MPKIKTAAETRPYRPCVGIMLLNNEGLVFVGNRIDTPGAHWQMPQGGIDPDEAPSDAAMRELHEETGITNAEIIAQTDRLFRYDLPVALSQRVWGGRFRGQEQHWFAIRFLGDDSEIRLDIHKPEFSEWRWMSVKELPDHIVPFKRPIYEDVILTFAHLTP
ncbi:MAG: RNA pyrophosphohydrolase [Alphaproteobacteria bacterium]|jgi:putative (di)nucleoside polyphosphate hydrolase